MADKKITELPLANTASLDLTSTLLEVVDVVADVNLGISADELIKGKISRVTSQDNKLVRFDGLDGDLQSSNITVDDFGVVKFDSYSGNNNEINNPTGIYCKENDGTLKSINLTDLNNLINPPFNIQGVVITGQILSIADNDLNKGYQWIADGVPITGATNSTFTVTSQEEGKVITLRQNNVYSQNSLSNFYPNELGVNKVVFWLDASDQNTITSISSLVSQWDDKSGNGNHFIQNNGSRQPITGIDNLNSLNGINFNGSKVIEHDVNSSSSDFTLVTALNALSFDSTLTRVLDIESGGNRRVYIQRGNIGSGGFAMFDGSTWKAVSDVSESNTGLQIQVFAETTSTGGVYVNGNQITSDTFANRAWNATTVIGKQNTDSFNSVVGDIMLITQDATIETRQKLEGYLAWKYNLVSDLPISHPYKTIAP